MTKASTRSTNRYRLSPPGADRRGGQTIAEPLALRHLPATAGVAVAWVASWLALIIWVLAVLVA